MNIKNPCGVLLSKAIRTSLIELFGEQIGQTLETLSLVDTKVNEGSVSLDRLFNNLETTYGIDASKGILFRVGELSIQFLRREDADMYALGQTENRLKPFEQKITSALETLRTILNREMNYKPEINSSTANSWEVAYSIASGMEKTETEKLMWLQQGMISAFLGWMDSRKVFRFSAPQINNIKRCYESRFSASAIE